MNEKKRRPGRKVEAEKRRIARAQLREYLGEHHEELPRKIVLAIMMIIGQPRNCSNNKDVDWDLQRRIYGE